MGRLPDRCLKCGRFVGFYPVGFYCDRHCRNCICLSCPGVDGPGVYRVESGPDLNLADRERICDGEFAGPNACTCGNPASHD